MLFSGAFPNTHAWNQHLLTTVAKRATKRSQQEELSDEISILIKLQPTSSNMVLAHPTRWPNAAKILPNMNVGQCWVKCWLCRGFRGKKEGLQPNTCESARCSVLVWPFTLLSLSLPMLILLKYGYFRKHNVHTKKFPLVCEKQKRLLKTLFGGLNLASNSMRTAIR